MSTRKTIHVNGNASLTVSQITASPTVTATGTQIKASMTTTADTDNKEKITIGTHD